jgi:hypothetical protein
MKTSIIYFTNRHCYSVEEAKEQFGDNVSEEHWARLLSNIICPDVASKVDGFVEIRGELYLLFDYELHSPGLIIC